MVADFKQCIRTKRMISDEYEVGMELKEHIEDDECRGKRFERLYRAVTRIETPPWRDQQRWTYFLWFLMSSRATRRSQQPRSLWTLSSDMWSMSKTSHKCTAWFDREDDRAVRTSKSSWERFEALYGRMKQAGVCCSDHEKLDSMLDSFKQFVHTHVPKFCDPSPLGDGCKRESREVVR